MGDTENVVSIDQRHIVNRFAQSLVNAALAHVLTDDEARKVHVEAYVRNAQYAQGEDQPFAALVPATSHKDVEGNVVFDGPAGIAIEGGSPETILAACYIGAAKAIRWYRDGQKKGAIPKEIYDPATKTGIVFNLGVDVPETWNESCETLLRLGAAKGGRAPLSSMRIAWKFPGEEEESSVSPKLLGWEYDKLETFFSRIEAGEELESLSYMDATEYALSQDVDEFNAKLAEKEAKLKLEMEALAEMRKSGLAKAENKLTEYRKAKETRRAEKAKAEQEAQELVSKLRESMESVESEEAAG